jgi:hypothetical protein
MNRLKKRIGNMLRRDRFKWYLYRILKSAKEPFMPPCGETMPILIFGMQRSGTTMLLIMLAKHPLVKAYSEHPGNSLFLGHRIRDARTLREHVERSRYPFLAVKPICDSHIASHIMDSLEDSRTLWAIRDYRDSSLSSLKKFSSPGPAIEALCSGRQEAAGWFGEGIPENDLETIRSLCGGNKPLSPFDMACLVWWARNRSFFHQSLQDRENVKVVSYRKMAHESEYITGDISSFLGLEIEKKHTGFIHARSVGKRSVPELDSRIDRLCSELYDRIYALS